MIIVESLFKKYSTHRCGKKNDLHMSVSDFRQIGIDADILDIDYGEDYYEQKA